MTHPDAFTGHGPADRISEFLTARAKDRMADPERITSYGRGGVIYELRVSDLRALIAAAPAEES